MRSDIHISYLSPDSPHMPKETLEDWIKGLEGTSKPEKQFPLGDLFDRSVEFMYPHVVERLEFPRDPNKDCKDDHGERTNYKLRDQPFHHRGRNGKMARY